MRIRLTVNGEPSEADVWGGESLLFALRERLGLPGSKNACEQGECGSCSVLLDGVLVCACLVLAAQADGHEVVTVEGLAEGDEPHAVQQAFVETGAVQCGFCTPGLVVATVDLLARSPDPTEDEIREALSGNLCRCGLREDLRRREARCGRFFLTRVTRVPTLPLLTQQRNVELRACGAPIVPEGARLRVDLPRPSIAARR